MMMTINCFTVHDDDN